MWQNLERVCIVFFELFGEIEVKGGGSENDKRGLNENGD